MSVRRFEQFPVAVDMDEERLWIHRPIDIEHQMSSTCVCCPVLVTRDEVQMLTVDHLNAMMTGMVQ